MSVLDTAPALFHLTRFFRQTLFRSTRHLLVRLRLNREVGSLGVGKVGLHSNYSYLL
jgi:hypothetical protein